MRDISFDIPASTTRLALQSDLTQALAPLAVDPFVTDPSVVDSVTTHPSVVDPPRGPNIATIDPGARLALMNHRAMELGIRTSQGHAVSFVMDTPKRRRSERKPVNAGFSVSSYEYRVWTCGEVPTRPNHAHDLCNFAVWCLFPQAKAALNARQIAAAERREVRGGDQIWEGRRTPEQDALSMLDEGSLLEVRHESKRQWFVFGHALFESMIHGVAGIRGMMVRIEIGRDRVVTDRSQLRFFADQQLAQKIGDLTEFQSNHQYGSVKLDGLLDS